MNVIIINIESGNLCTSTMRYRFALNGKENDYEVKWN